MGGVVSDYSSKPRDDQYLWPAQRELEIERVSVFRSRLIMSNDAEKEPIFAAPTAAYGGESAPIYQERTKTKQMVISPQWAIPYINGTPLLRNRFMVPSLQTIIGNLPFSPPKIQLFSKIHPLDTIKT